MGRRHKKARSMGSTRKKSLSSRRSGKSLLGSDSTVVVDTVKRKVAPRSGEQFKIGPQFEPIVTYEDIYLGSTDEIVLPVIEARIDRGFDQIDGQWTGYKRNYFSLVTAFHLKGLDMLAFFDDNFYVSNGGSTDRLKCFALRLVGECCENDLEVTLVQHTAKRDRGPQYQPAVFASVPGILPSHEIIKRSANVRNNAKLNELNKIFYLDHADHPSGVDEDAIINSYPKGKVTKVAKYERMQFSTANRYKKPAINTRHFILRVELLGVTTKEKFVTIASIETPPLVIRGRSPSNYAVNTEPETCEFSSPHSYTPHRQHQLKKRPIKKPGADKRQWESFYGNVAVFLDGPLDEEFIESEVEPKTPEAEDNNYHPAFLQSNPSLPFQKLLPQRHSDRLLMFRPKVPLIHKDSISIEKPVELIYEEEEIPLFLSTPESYYNDKENNPTSLNMYDDFNYLDDGGYNHEGKNKKKSKHKHHHKLENTLSSAFDEYTYESTNNANYELFDQELGNFGDPYR